MIWDTLPIIWLLVLCIYDVINDFMSKAFFCKVVDEVHRKMEIIRGKDTEWECPTLNSSCEYDCPIFYTLDKYKANLIENCPKVFKEVKVNDALKANDAFWTAINDGFLRSHQAMYFEIIFIQFFITGLTTNVEDISLLCFIIALLIFLFPYFLLTHSSHKPILSFENKYLRLTFVFCIWLFIIGLSEMKSVPFEIPSIFYLK